MVVSTDSRRKSIAVAHEGHTTIPKKKRAHSIGGASKLSPLARSRLSIGHVKGILKSRSSLTVSARSYSPSSSSQSRPQSQSFADDKSMDLTQDLRVPLHDNHGRKSLGRRVSFKNTATLRYFDKPDKVKTTSSPSDSVPSSSDDDPSPPPAQVVNDENAYPGANNRRRSSVRKSLAPNEDMDMTSTSAGAFLTNNDDSTLLDEGMDFNENSDMDTTQTFGSNIRRRSSVAPSRAPLQQINPEESFTSDQSYTSDGDRSEPMEFTVPLNNPLRPPANQDEVWLALVRATHSGDASLAASDDSDRPDVDEIVARDNKGRYTYNFDDVSNDSMSISDASLGDVEDAGNRTLNLSQVIGRVSVGESVGRSSLASAISMDESEVYGHVDVPISYAARPSLATGNFGRPSVAFSVHMDESEVYGDIIAPATSTPRASLAPQMLESPELSPTSDITTAPSPVSSAPPLSAKSLPTTVFRAPSPKKIPAFTPKSPVKSAPRQFSAAFAPPVARPSPKKRTETDEVGTSDSGNKKRERTISAPSERPSPAKRQALEARWSTSAKTTPPTPSVDVEPSPMQAEKPRALSPNKRAPFQPAPAPVPSSSGIRRPSGYFARRKSIGPITASTSSAAPEQSRDAAPIPASSSPKTNGRARASMVPEPSDGTRFDKSSVISAKNAKGKEKATFDDQYEEEPSLAEDYEVMATSDPAAANSPIVESMDIEIGPFASKTHPVDLSSVFEDEEEEARDEPPGLDTAATEEWRDAVPEDGYLAEESPPISIAQFFQMTGIGFMDVSAPRRSMHPSQIAQKPRDRAEISLAEYANAMAFDLPQLVLYTRVSQDIEEQIQKCKIEYQQLEEEVMKVTPELFSEYTSGNQEIQEELVQQLKKIKRNTWLKAKSDWYDWKLEWVEDLKCTAQQALTSLQNDARSLETIKTKADEILPQLQQEYDEIMRELEAEQQEVAEVEQCDQEYLAELKTSIAEQNIEVETLRAEVQEADDQLRWLEERLENLALQKKEAITGISEANRALHIQTNSTRVEVFRLKNELQALEDLHMFHASKIHSDVFEYIYASEYQVIIPCRNYHPATREIEILRLPEMQTKCKDDFPRLTSFLISAAKEHVRRSEASTVRHIVQKLADFWSSTRQLRAQIRQLSLKYPVEIEPRQTPEKPFSEFAARAMVLFPAKKAKAYIYFVCNSDVFSRWPLSIGTLRWEVKVGYGPINAQSIVEAISERMSPVTPSDTYACMIDACIQAQELYS